jgi:sterol desaturase/sphingolipid hydroxylase (fatty acid hydroxylase superfamily)
MSRSPTLEKQNPATLRAAPLQTRLPVIGFIVGFVILAVLFSALEWKWPARKQKRWRRGMWTDLAFWLATPIASRVILVVSIAAFAVTFVVCSGGKLDQAHIDAFVHRPTWLNTLPIAAQIAIMAIGGELIGYWLHRLAHRGALWSFHKLHHSSVDLDWLSAVRVHPIDDLLRRAVNLVVLFAVGFDGTLVAGAAPVMALYAVLLHANVPWTFGPLRYVIASPAFHRWHHSADNLHCNYGGLFPLWDLVFGTFYLPAAQPAQFGLASTTSPQ